MSRPPRTLPRLGSIIGLAHSLGLTVIAEGVERIEQVERLRELGCEQGQGIYFAPPLTAGELMSWLRSPFLSTPMPAVANELGED